MYRKYNTNIVALKSANAENLLLFGAKTGVWQYFYRESEAMYVLHRVYHMRLQYAPLYILKVKLVQAHFLVDAETYSITYNQQNLPTTTGDKLKYFRYQKGLLQKEVAEYVGMDRGAYSSFESTHRDYYDKEKILKIAEILEVDIADIMDEYNLFLHNEPHLKIRNFRMSQGLTQKQFAEKYDIQLYAVKMIEQGKRQIFRSTWERLLGNVL